MGFRWPTTAAWWASPWAALPGTLPSAPVSAKATTSAAAILKFVFLGVWLLVCFMEAMLRDLDLLLGRLPTIACLIPVCTLLGMPALVGIVLPHGSPTPAVLLFVGSSIWRELARHLTGHLVGAMEAVWKMRGGGNSVNQHVTWLLMSSVIPVLFVKKVVSSGVGYLIRALMLNRYWLCFPQQSRAWDVGFESVLSHPGRVLFLCMLLLPPYDLMMLLNRVIPLDLGSFEFVINNNMKLHYDLCLLLYHFV